MESVETHNGDVGISVLQGKHGACGAGNSNGDDCYAFYGKIIMMSVTDTRNMNCIVYYRAGHIYLLPTLNSLSVPVFAP